MEELNLKKIYPDIYSKDEIIYVDKEIAEVIRKDELQQEAYRIKTLRYRAGYSLNLSDNIESHALHLQNTEDKFIEAEIKKKLYISISKLTKKQQQRIYAYYFIGLSKSEIAKSEGVNVSTISKSIKRSVIKLKKYF